MLSAAQLQLLARRRVRHRCLHQPKSLSLSQSIHETSQAFLFELIADELLARLDYVKIQPQSLMLMCAGVTQNDTLNFLKRLRQLYVASDVFMVAADLFSRDLFDQVVSKNNELYQPKKNKIEDYFLSLFKKRKHVNGSDELRSPVIKVLLRDDAERLGLRRVDLCLPIVLPMDSGGYQSLSQLMVRTGMVHGAVISALVMRGEVAIAEETKHECINPKSLGDMLAGQGFQELVIDSWRLPLAYRSLDQMLIELSPWWTGQIQKELPLRGLQGRKKLEQFKIELKQQTYVAATGLFELDVECLFFQAIYDPLQVKKNEFSIFPDQIKIRSRS